jgi:hypothetical protein
MKGKQFGKILACLILCTGVLFTCAAPFASAQNGQGTAENGAASSASQPAGTAKQTSPDSLAGKVLASDPSSAASPVTEEPKEPAASYRKIFSFSSDQLFSGIYKSSEFYFSVEKYWKTVYAFARIEFSVSPLIRNVPASLTFFVNSTPVSSCKVDYGSGKTQVAYIEIPVSALKTGYNKLTVSGFVRLYDDNGCLDDFSGANWVNISKNSLVQVGYETVDARQELSYYPYPFLSSVDGTGKDCAVYVPAGASGEEMVSALLLRADLGGKTDGEDRISLKELSQYGRDGIRHRVVVALRSELPASLAAAEKQSSVSLQKNAAVFEAADSGGETLVVTSDNVKALYEGAAMLMDSDRVSQEKKSFACVKAGSADTVIQNSKLSGLVANNYTVQGITGGGLSFIGPFHHEQEVFLPLSGGFILSEGGKVVLNFRYSDNLDFKRSLVTVYWGNVPVCSKKLERSRAGGDTLSFLLPSDVVGTYAGSIKIAFDLELEDLYCTKRADEMPWAYVMGNSTFYLPVGQGSRYSFDTRPYPFQKLGLFNSTCVVIPDSMSSTELNTLGEVIAMEGNGVSPYGSLSVVRASKFSKANYGSNLILLGTYRDNKVLASLNDKLSFAYVPGGSRFASNKQLLLSDDYAADIGVLQLLRSPYASGKAILAVSGSKDANLAAIGSYLAEQTKRWTLSGDAFLIDSDFETKNYTFLKDQEKKSPSLGETLQQNRSAVVFTLVSTFAMLILLLAVILVILRARRHRDEENK